MSNGSLSSSVHAARLCHIIQWKHFDGYGFNLHAEKGKPGQYIGKVDEGSPAEAAGLKQGDRIIEVNGVNIANENHKQVVQRIKAVPNETKLLVVDSEADKYYKSNNIIIKSSLPEVKYLKTPMSDEDCNVQVNDEKKQETAEDSQSLSSNNDANPEKRLSSSASTPSSDRKNSDDFSPETQTELTNESNDSALRSTDSNKSTADHNSVNGAINLSMTAKELRAKLASRKKYDPKKDSMDFKKKFEIVQTL
ncbi:Na(+)/H(+) exchange regulatory cofactor NHE-RF1 [Anabrus simplex]|uniref:Na(+)/H(+) exchange regulatory cofactor NHE-RF1 n=1 Tax=Anabrus simplex TaxID=316456 RepID=UPI0034DDBE3E